jgi:hypothetical protein
VTREPEFGMGYSLSRYVYSSAYLSEHSWERPSGFTFTAVIKIQTRPLRISNPATRLGNRPSTHISVLALLASEAPQKGPIIRRPK